MTPAPRPIPKAPEPPIDAEIVELARALARGLARVHHDVEQAAPQKERSP